MLGFCVGGGDRFGLHMGVSHSLALSLFTSIIIQGPASTSSPSIYPIHSPPSAEQPDSGGKGSLSRASTNANFNPSSLWLLAEVIRNPSLLSRVRAVIDACYLPLTLTAITSNRPRLELTALLSDPLLQSLYAKMLRLRVASFLFRGRDQLPLHLDHWHILQDAAMLDSTHHAQMDTVVRDGKAERPVAEFWPDQFLAAEEQKGERVIRLPLRRQRRQRRLQGRMRTGQQTLPQRHRRR